MEIGMNPSATPDQSQCFTHQLEAFDDRFETLIDYFVILGVDQSQIRSSLLKLNSSPKEIQDLKLRASVLDRFPHKDRSTLAFPPEITKFFFDDNEVVY